MSLAPLVGELRRMVTTPGHPDAVAAAAASRPAGRGRVPSADPSSWVGVGTALRRAAVRDDDDSVPLSPSRLETFRRCELRWFLESCGGSSPSGMSQGVGSAVHKVAESAPAGADVDDVSSPHSISSSRGRPRSGWVRRQRPSAPGRWWTDWRGWLRDRRDDPVATEQASRCRSAAPGCADRSTAWSETTRAVRRWSTTRPVRPDRQGRAARARPARGLPGGRGTPVHSLSTA